MNTNNTITVTALDLGSSAIKIAAVIKGGVEIITNQANFRQTPNVVGFCQAQRNIGQAGQVKIKSNHTNTVIAPSRFLGFNYLCPYIKQQLTFCPAKPKRVQSNQQYIKFNLQHGNSHIQLSPQQLCGSFLTQIQKTISKTNDLDNRNLVISIPSYYNQSQRKCLLYSTKLMYSLGTYPIQLVEQEICVAMDYGYGRRLEFGQQSKNVLFVDFGHSKTNLFVAGFSKQSFRVLATRFHRTLGCKHIDMQLIKFYANMFDQKNTHVQLKLMESKKALLKLLDSVEKQRKVLSGTNQHDLSIECLLQEQDLAYTMKREQFQEIAQPIINNFRQLLTDFANQLKQKGISFDQIQLIGGGTRIPIIIKTISEVFKLQPSRTVNSNESIARGAALISAMNSSIFKVQSYNYFKINPYQVNFKINNDVIMPIFTKNEILLRQKVLQVDVRPQVEKFIVEVEYANQLQQGLQKRIMKFPVEIISKVLRKQPQMNQQNQQNQNLKLKFVFSLDCNGLICLSEVTSLNVNFNVIVGQVNTFEKYTETQISNMQHKQKQMALRDQRIKRFYEDKNQFQSFIYKTNQKVDEIVQDNQSFVNESHVSQIKNLLSQEQNWLNTFSATDQYQLVEEFRIKSENINQMIQNLIKQIQVTKKHIEQRSKQSSHHNQPQQGHHQPLYGHRMAQSQYRPRTRQAQKSNPFNSNLFGNTFNRFF